ncbi:MAG: Ig-like domain-containing protein [Bacteroidetes bacterium]|nr:Ig-like domain-containing protein [Bacteroidota bacterium]
MKKYILIIVLLTATRSFAQTPSVLQNYFQQAASEFNVPASVLEALAYIETHWQPIPNIPGRSPMGLRNDSRFNYNLDSAAKLIGKPVKTLEDSAYQNIRGAAAFLSHLRDEANADSTVVDSSDLVSWWPVIAEYSGIPQPDIAMEFACHTLEELQMGVNDNGIVIPKENIDLSGFPDSVKATGFRQPADSLMTPVWVGSPNYSSRNGAPIVFVIIHDTEEQFDYAHSLFEDPSDQASAHYLVRSQDGYIDQFVHNSDKAWAVVCWNSITLNIEHEGFVATPSFYTETEYESSARLTASLCEEYNIPEDSLHIFGHDAWTYSWFNLIPFSLYTQYVGTGFATCNTHTDPGQYWNWHHYFDLIHQYDTTRATVVGSTPATGDTGVVGNAAITVDFSKPMEPTSTESAFAITPVVAGHFSFNPSYTQLTFRPDSHYSSLTQYKVTIADSAKSTNLRPITAPYTFQFTIGRVDTTGPHLIRVSPENGGTSIAKSYVEFVLNEPVHLDSIASQISFIDSTGKSVPFTVFLSRITSNGLTLIAVRSSVNLTPGMRYTVTLGPGIKDYFGIRSTKAFSTTFSGDTAESSGGSVLEGFESSLGNWLQPAENTGTIGIDSKTTNFGVAYNAYDGFGSGQLNYQFDSSYANCVETNSTGFDISSATSVGMWVFGDDSGNELDFIFGSSPEKIVPIDTIDWYGYKYVGMWRSTSDASTALFRGFAVKRLQSALLDSSTIFVDDIQINGKVTGVRGASDDVPTSFRLFQNFPNPFNPTTSIRYQLPKSCHVLLKIYDTIGRNMSTLVNDNQSAGTYSVSFNASRFPSGLYFYRLDAGSFTATKKMMLVK